MDRDWLIRKHNDLRGWLWGLVPGLALIALLSVLGHGIWVGGRVDFGELRRLLALEFSGPASSHGAAVWPG